MHYENALLQKTLRKGRVNFSIATSLEIYVLQLRSEKFLQRSPTPEKEENDQAVGNYLGSTHLLPIRQPQQLVCVGCGRANKHADEHRVPPQGCCFLARPLCPRAVPCHAAAVTAGWATRSRGRSRSCAARSPTLLGLCLFTTVKLIYVQEVLLKI